MHSGNNRRSLSCRLLSFWMIIQAFQYTFRKVKSLFTVETVPNTELWLWHISRYEYFPFEACKRISIVHVRHIDTIPIWFFLCQILCSASSRARVCQPSPPPLLSICRQLFEGGLQGWAGDRSLSLCTHPLSVDDGISAWWEDECVRTDFEDRTRGLSALSTVSCFHRPWVLYCYWCSCWRFMAFTWNFDEFSTDLLFAWSKHCLMA